MSWLLVMVMVLLVAFAFWRPLFAGDPLLPDDQLWFGDPWNVDAPAGERRRRAGDETRGTRRGRRDARNPARPTPIGYRCD